MRPIRLVADIYILDENVVTFRGVLDESYPETIIIKMTRQRWDRLNRSTMIPITLFEPTEKEG